MQAVVDLRCGAHVQNCFEHIHIFGFDVHAADRISRIFFVGKPFGRGAGCTLIAERKHAGTSCFGVGEGVGVNADEQVRLHFLCFFHAVVQGHKKICIPR